LPLAVCMASADHDVAGTFPAGEDASSGSDELSKEKRWDRIRALRTTAVYSPQHKDHNFAIASGFGRYSRGFLGVLNLTRNRSELMKLAEEKQQELDERRGVTEDVFHKGRNETALDSKREAWHDSFRSRRKQKVPANPAMLQALQTAHKIKENSFKEATEHQASLLLQGRFVSQEVPMDRKFNIRSRRLSGGQEIIQSAASLTKIWATKGTDDDKFRPENNAAGFIAPTAHEAVSDILAQAEKDRVEELLRQCLLAQRPHSRTHPVTPRLGPHPTEELSSAEAPSENDDDPFKSTSPRLGGYSNHVSDRPLCYMRAPSEKKNKAVAAFLRRVEAEQVHADGPRRGMANIPKAPPTRPSPTRSAAARVQNTRSADARRAQTELFFKKFWKSAQNSSGRGSGGAAEAIAVAAEPEASAKSDLAV